MTPQQAAARTSRPVQELLPHTPLDPMAVDGYVHVALMADDHNVMPAPIIWEGQGARVD